MTPHTQVFLHDPANGVYGDCFRTCVASLLDLAPEEVPHFHGEETWQEQDDRMRDWLAMRGLSLINFSYQGGAPIDEFLASCVHVIGSNCRFMLTGTSPRGTNHVVVAAPVGVIHDPHPDGGGLTGPSDDGNWWLTFLGKLV